MFQTYFSQTNVLKNFIRIFLPLMFQTHVSPAAAFENPRWELWKIPCFRNFCENVLAVMFCIYMFNSETWPFFSEWVVKLCKYRRDPTVRTTRHLLMPPTTFVSTIECLRLEYFYQMVMEYFHQIFPSIISIKWLSRNIGIFEIFLSNVFGIFLSNVYLELSYLYFLLKPYLSLCLAALLLVFNEKNRCK